MRLRYASCDTNHLYRKMWMEKRIRNTATDHMEVMLDVAIDARKSHDNLAGAAYI